MSESQSLSRVLIFTYHRVAALFPNDSRRVMVAVDHKGYDVSVLEAVNPKILVLYVGERMGAVFKKPLKQFLQEQPGRQAVVLYCSHAQAAVEQVVADGDLHLLTDVTYFPCECGAPFSVGRLAVWFMTNDEIPTESEWESCFCPEVFRVTEDITHEKDC